MKTDKSARFRLDKNIKPGRDSDRELHAEEIPVWQLHRNKAVPYRAIRSSRPAKAEEDEANPGGSKEAEPTAQGRADRQDHRRELCRG